MPYKMEHFALGSDPSKIKDRYIVINAITGKHFSTTPQTKEKADAQMRILQEAETNTDVIKGHRHVAR